MDLLHMIKYKLFSRIKKIMLKINGIKY